ncbi:2-dehydro-3-deoxygluconokinase [Luteimonas sp. J16]|nr:2-dehydro-3-deoxygluconokinase [Luteimonas sp. J16]
MVLGADPGAPGDDTHGHRFARAARRAFDAFPRLQRIACTVRSQASVEHHALGALMATRDGDLHRVEDRALSGIVDRIGAGDAFAAGVLHGLLAGWSDADSLRFGHAAGCLKHAVPGDFNRCGEDDVLALVRGGRLDVKR